MTRNNTYSHDNIKLIILYGAENEAFRVLNHIIKKDGTFDAINTFVVGCGAGADKNSNIYYRYNVSYNDVQAAFKNNAVVYCSAESAPEEPVRGIMSDEWENGNIVCISFSDFNKIHSRYLSNANTVAVWISGGNIYCNRSAHFFKEQQYALDRIENENIPCLYYNAEKESAEEISNITLKYINETDERIKSIILKENS